MAITTQPDTRPPISCVPSCGVPIGPIRRIIAGSLATGSVAAAVLTLVVFGGAGEHVVTGSALVGFGVGWAMLAVLSIRMTNQPQPWALVPAAGMAATGDEERGAAMSASAIDDLVHAVRTGAPLPSN